MGPDAWITVDVKVTSKSIPSDEVVSKFLHDFDSGFRGRFRKTYTRAPRAQSHRQADAAEAAGPVGVGPGDGDTANTPADGCTPQ
ncbi:hypothetical protein MCOR25_005272 [Pyricularia grisea]|nr:hypothetical protein MCOR25_005272 [Pyricularia grisea]